MMIANMILNFKRVCACGAALALLFAAQNVGRADETSGSDGKILQVAGQTPSASDQGVALGKAKKSESRNKAVADEINNLPNLGVRADDESTGHKPHGAKFLEVMPGVTKFSDLSKNPVLKDPVSTDKIGGFDVATFQTPTLPDVTIQVVGQNDVVQAIMINFAEPRSESDARTAFAAEIKDVRPIWAPDEVGNFREVFPEKGVAFVLEKGEKPGLPSNRVIQVVAETVKAEYFIMRAEQDLQTNYTHARDDAEHALLHEPNAPGAHWILAKTHLLVGDYSNSRRHIVAAIKLNDSLPQFHLTYIDALIQAGEVDSALRYMDAVRDSFVEHPLFAIEALCLDSALNLESAEPNYDKAISQGQRALKMLQALYETKPTGDVYIAAKQLELRANLCVALAVARKQWKNPADQEKAFEWLTAASDVAKEVDAARPQASELATAQIDVYETAVDVCLEMPDTRQVDSYAQKAKVAAELYLRKTVDEVSAAGVRWKIGRALVAASRIYEAREDFKNAKDYGAKGLEYLNVVTEYRSPLDRTATALAQLQLGAILLESGDQKNAIPYFDSANELLGQIENDVRSRDAAHLGAPLATVAAMYWKQGQKEKGVASLKRAVKFLDKAFADGRIKQDALYVPYSNLATMCKGVDDAAGYAKYKKLAEQVAPK